MVFVIGIELLRLTFRNAKIKADVQGAFRWDFLEPVWNFYLYLEPGWEGDWPDDPS